MSTLKTVLAAIRPADERGAEAARRHWNSICKPLNSLGLLEDAVVRMAAMGGSERVDISKRAIVVMCADNGVVAEGVTQTGQDVTAIVTENMSRHRTSVCCMSEVAGAQVVPVNIGVTQEVHGESILQRCLMHGTNNMVEGPVMDRATCVKAIETGIEIAEDLYRQGVGLLGTGEMGIGNTTTSSAILSVLLDKDPAQVTGRGAGLTSAGLDRKVNAIRRAIAVNRPDPADCVDVLSKVGGLDIAGLVGVFLGGAYCRIPVLVDGFISAVAALCAQRICPAAGDYMLASHVSNEPAGEMLLEALGLTPFLRAHMCLGEGTGTAAVMPLLDMGLAVYNQMPTFEETDVEAYQPLK